MTVVDSVDRRVSDVHVCSGESKLLLGKDGEGMVVFGYAVVVLYLAESLIMAVCMMVEKWRNRGNRGNCGKSRKIEKNCRRSTDGWVGSPDRLPGDLMSQIFNELLVLVEILTSLFVSWARPREGKLKQKIEAI